VVEGVEVEVLGVGQGSDQPVHIDPKDLASVAGVQSFQSLFGTGVAGEIDQREVAGGRLLVQVDARVVLHRLDALVVQEKSPHRLLLSVDHQQALAQELARRHQLLRQVEVQVVVLLEVPLDFGPHFEQEGAGLRSLPLLVEEGGHVLDGRVHLLVVLDRLLIEGDGLVEVAGLVLVPVLCPLG
jgi:hypothetical protein